MQDLISIDNKDPTTKRAAWFKIIEDYNDSGASQIDYCKKNDIKIDHFVYYLRQY